MAFSIKYEPGEVVLVNNPVEFEFKTDKPIVNSGAKWLYEIRFTGPLLPLQLVQFDINNVMVIYHVFPNSVYYQFKDDPLHIQEASTASEAAQNFEAALKRNTWVTTYYDVSRNGISVFMEAKEDGSDNEINIYWLGPSFWNAVPQLITRGKSTELLEGYRVKLELFVESEWQMNDFKRIASIPMASNSIGEIQVNIGSFLKGFFSDKHEVPKINEGSWKASNIQRQFRVIVNEIDKLDVYSTSYHSKSMVAWKAGVKHEHFPKYKNVAVDLIQKQNKFLSWRTTSRSVTVDQPEFLAVRGWKKAQNAPQLFYLPSNGLQITVLWNDGTKNTYNAYNEVAVGEIEVFNVSFFYLKQALSMPDKEPAQMNVVYYSTSNEVASESILYRFIQSSYLDTYFVYENSFGVFDTLKCSGEIHTDHVTKKTHYNRPLEFNYSEFNNNISATPISYQQQHKVQTGIMSEDGQDAFLEMVSSPRVYFLDGGQLVPIIIPASSYKTSQQEEGNYAFVNEFTFLGPHQLNFSK